MPMVIRLGRRTEATPSRPGPTEPGSPDPRRTAVRTLCFVAGLGLLVLLTQPILGMLLLWSLMRAVAPEGWAYPNENVPTLTPQQVATLIGEIERKYQVDVDTSGGEWSADDGTRRTSGRSPGQQELSAMLPALDEELGLYPAAALRGIGVKRLYLHRALANDGRLVGGTVSYERGHVYLNIGDMYDPSILRETVHHELYHAIDWLDDWTVSPDPSWARLNLPGFAYFGAVGPATAGLSTSVATRSPGFSSAYSKANEGEDKAELFAALMCHPGPLRDWCADDPVLKRKADFLRAQLSRLNWGFDYSYWPRLEQHRQAHPVPLPRW